MPEMCLYGFKVSLREVTAGGAVERIINWLCTGCFSSEDELDVLLNGTPDQKKKLIREYLTGESESSSGDEFEKEMEAELSSTMRTMEGAWGPSAAGNADLQIHSPG